jgi:taurine dioxygenase
MTQLSITPVTPELGAEIRDVDLRTAGADAIAAIQRAFADHAVLFIRDQALTLDDLLAVTRKFGSILRVPYVQGVPSHPDVIAVLKEASEKKISTFGGTWHSDFSFLAEPPAATLLYAVELPPVGGDTIWSSQYLAYAALSDGMKAMLDTLRAIHTGWPHGTMGPSPDVPVSKSIKMVRNDPSADREVVHPVVRVHPVTGKKALFVNPVYTQRFEGMTVAESKPLLEYLHQHSVRAEFCCRLRWSKGTLAMWDNRCLMHLAVNDYDGHRRLLYRTTTAGEAPSGIARQAA